MGYYLNAFIFNHNDADVFKNNFDQTRQIQIGQGVTLVPMTTELFDQINDPQAANSNDKFEYLTDFIETKILQTMGNKRFAYLEAEYFGGEGGQIAIIWSNGKREVFFEYGQEGINSVLKSFDVKPDIGKDEFDTLNLGRHRNTKRWIEDNQ